jgi:sec-independent protein translocase protein TatB
MDTFCGIGLPELVIIILLAFVVIGPERSKDLALQLGRWLSKLMRSPWWREFNQITQALREMPTTLVRMAELEEAQRDIQRSLQDIDQETQIDFDPARPGTDPVQQAGQPASPEDPDPDSDPWGIRSSAPAAPPRKPEPAAPEEDGLEPPLASPDADDTTAGEER